MPIDDIAAVVSRRPWQSRFHALPEWARKVPTMLTPEEGRMLCWLGEHAFTGTGAVCDTGCFLGGSTARLAAGLARSGRPWQMHSYDRFEASEDLKEKFLYSAGYPRFEGKDIFPLFQQHIAPQAAHITAHRGDFQDFPWTGGPIEILFIDIAKSVETNAFLLEHFFPALIPGRSIVVQQDYLFYRTPWLITTMELLHPKLELIGWTQDNSALFRCNAAIGPADLAAANFDTLRPADVIDLIRRTRDRFAFDYQREIFDLAIEAYERKPSARQAWAFPDVVAERHRGKPAERRSAA